MKLIRAYFFDAVPEKRVSDKKSAFLDMLRSNEINVITKPLKYRNIRCDTCVLGLKLVDMDEKIKLPNITQDEKAVVLKQECQEPWNKFQGVLGS